MLLKFGKEKQYEKTWWNTKTHVVVSDTGYIGALVGRTMIHGYRRKVMADLKDIQAATEKAGYWIWLKGNDKSWLKK